MKGYRKFAVVMAALLFAFILALCKSLTAEFATIASVCVGAYQLAHAVADHAYAKNGAAGG